MSATAKPCTLGPKHKWTHVRDITIKNISMGPRGTTVRMSARGEYLSANAAVSASALRKEACNV